MSGPPATTITPLAKRLARSSKTVAKVTAPEDLASTHALIRSAWELADNALRLRARSGVAEQRRRGAARLVCGCRRPDAVSTRAGGSAGRHGAAGAQVITPRRTRLLRAPDLAGYRAHLIDLARALDPDTAADTFVLVPTRRPRSNWRARSTIGCGVPRAPSLAAHRHARGSSTSICSRACPIRRALSRVRARGAARRRARARRKRPVTPRPSTSGRRSSPRCSRSTITSVVSGRTRRRLRSVAGRRARAGRGVGSRRVRSCSSKRGFLSAAFRALRGAADRSGRVDEHAARALIASARRDPALAASGRGRRRSPVRSRRLLAGRRHAVHDAPGLSASICSPPMASSRPVISIACGWPSSRSKRRHRLPPAPRRRWSFPSMAAMRRRPMTPRVDVTIAIARTSSKPWRGG